eukprot:Sspe_Gene.22125::Locus_8372_Transcript_1_1_Confidence_1.000_Length_2020::g.22125::m.22125
MATLLPQVGVLRKDDLRRVLGVARVLAVHGVASQCALYVVRYFHSPTLVRPDAPLPPVALWPQYPVFFRANPCVPCVMHTDAVPINSEAPVPFETELFFGHVTMCLRNTPNSATNPWGEGERFAPKKRHTVMTIQGRFKRSIPCNEVLCGWEWARPLENLPWGCNTLLSVFEKVSPGMWFNIGCPSPHIYNLLAGGADSIHAGEGCGVMEQIVPERWKWKTAKERQRAMRGGGARQHVFEEGVEYTFDFFGDKLILTDFIGIIGVVTVNLAKYFAGQPFPFVAKTTQGTYLWFFELWHESLVPREATPTLYSFGSTRHDSMSVMSIPASGLCTPIPFGQGSNSSPMLPPDPSRSSRRRKLKNQWAAWDSWDYEPQRGTRVFASMVMLLGVAVAAWVVAWWHSLISHRLHRAFTKWPPEGGLACTLSALGGVFLVGLVGVATDFFRRAGGTTATVLQVMLGITLSVTSEIIFRAMSLPHPDERAPIRIVGLWAVLSLSLYVAHFPLVAICCHIAYPTLLDPRFLALCTILGMSSTALYLRSGSIWPSLITNSTVAVVWLLRLGGSRRLRRVRIELPEPDVEHYQPRRPTTPRNGPLLDTPLLPPDPLDTPLSTPMLNPPAVS